MAEVTASEGDVGGSPVKSASESPPHKSENNTFLELEDPDTWVREHESGGESKGRQSGFGRDSSEDSLPMESRRLRKRGYRNKLNGSLPDLSSITYSPDPDPKTQFLRKMLKQDKKPDKAKKKEVETVTLEYEKNPTPAHSVKFYSSLEKEWDERDLSTRQQESVYSTILWMPVLVALRVLNIWLGIIFTPISLFLRVVFGYKMQPAKFWDVPLERRKQTCAVLFFIVLLPLCSVAYSLGFILLFVPVLNIGMILYIFYILRWDDAPTTGKKQPFMRYWKMWRHFTNYFPCRLVKTHNLDPTGKYVFCYHPHGIISLGAFGNFATDATGTTLIQYTHTRPIKCDPGFSRKFPGIDLRLLTLQLNFYCPFLREILLNMGMCSAAKRSCNQILQRGPGSAIMLVVGGAAESLDAKPGTYRLTLERQGFVRVALDNGASLVPVLGFGETDVFDAYVYPPGSFIRNLQDKFKSKFGFAIPLFHGRGIFNYSWGIMPHRKPIYAVVGKPVKVPIAPAYLRGSKLYTTKEGRALVEKYHREYIDALTELYNQFKNKWALNRAESMQISFRKHKQPEER